MRAGNYSVACSEPKRIENLDLVETINRLKKETEPNSNLTNRQLIKDFTKGVCAVVERDEYFGISFRSILEWERVNNRYPLYQAFSSMANVRLLTGLQWVVCF